MSDSRIIINNRADLDNWNVLDLVRRVVEAGRISNNGQQYSYATTFKASPQLTYVVATDRTKAGTDSFTIYAEAKYD